MTSALAAKQPANRAEFGEEGTPSLARPLPGNQHETRSLLANTLIMYGRTLLTMSVSLYSSRIVLAELGAVDYGIYFAVAGVTLVIAFLNSALATSTQRHLSVGLAQGDMAQLRSVFSASLQIHAAIALAILLASQTFGLWFLHNHMVIPPERVQAGSWALKCAALSVALTVFQVPYNALLTATERFSVFAAFDIAHALLKLFVAFALFLPLGDRLEVFASLLVGATCVIFVAKVGYCLWAFEGSRYRPCADLSILRRLATFAGWSLVEGFSLILNIHGFGLLLNLHFGPVVNASQGIATQLVNATSTLASNLQLTASPRIMKSFFTQDVASFQILIERNAKAAYFLMLVLVVPVALQANAVLTLWLGTVPDHAVGLVRLLLLVGLVNSMSSPLVSAIQATGRIRRYQLIVGGLLLTSVPIGALLLSFGAGPLSIYWFLLLLSAVALAIRVQMARHLVGLVPGKFATDVLWPAILVTALSFASGELLSMALAGLWLGEICSIAGTAVITAGLIYVFGFSDSERLWLGATVTSRFQHVARRRT
ncbi:hypothetical protein [Rhizobium sp. AG855]|uniref:lipopolysaccharide biosynthesis protein n=1 Tax=Rhizobium sp. AG855 TaxID=2183898 RepID=UPI000FF6CAC7|nr:hypothetical protein [Rhizobium sp. AG855]RKE79222.1 O-antigen/teichoic acid export membrane protein [Rhizobium sp. AG855]